MTSSQDLKMAQMFLYDTNCPTNTNINRHFHHNISVQLDDYFSKDHEQRINYLCLGDVGHIIEDITEIT